MKIENNINFKAIPINNTYINKYDIKQKKFVPLETCFVQIDETNSNDLNAVRFAFKK